MDSILFSKVNVTDPGGPHDGRLADVLVESGKVTRIAAAGSLSAPAGAQTRAGGCLSPGWVDMRVHLSVPGHEQKDDWDSLSAAALAGGFGRIVTMPNTHPAIDQAGQVRSLLRQTEQLPIHVHPAGAVSVGSKGQDLAELYDMHQAGAVAFSDGLHPIQSAGLLLRALQYCKPFGALVMQFPLDMALAGAAEVGEGLVATQIGMKGIPALAEELPAMRDLKLLEYYPQRLHLGPVTTAAALEVLRQAKAKHPGLSIETSALYLLLDDTVLLDFDVNAKVWPPLRTKSDVEALRQAVRDGLVDVVSSSHHPQGLEEKLHDFADAAYGAESLETSFAAVRTALGGSADLGRIVAAMSSNPRRILGLPGASIAEGAEAELSHFDPDQVWTPQASDIRSKCKNNPLIGRKLQGKPLGVYVKGRYQAV